MGNPLLGRCFGDTRRTCLGYTINLLSSLGHAALAASAVQHHSVPQPPSSCSPLTSLHASPGHAGAVLLLGDGPWPCREGIIIPWPKGCPQPCPCSSPCSPPCLLRC